MSSKRGIDTLLTSQGKRLKTGQEIRFTLVKGPSHRLNPDPVNPKAPKQQFPLIAKFPQSVVKPDLDKAPWNTSRLFQQDAPKAQEDSDEETTEAKKRWRPRQDIPKRQWVFQEQVEFLEQMMLKAQRKPLPKSHLSTQYKGVPEYNPSQFILLETPRDDTQIQVTTLPTPKGTIAFSQPKATKTLSMTEAEHAISDQRGKMTRYMMHDKQRLLNGNEFPQNQSRKRLFGKLKASGNPNDDDEDDIMGDLAFRNRKSSGRSRKELLDSLGDSGIKVDADGVLGGADDAEFGKGQRFGRFKANEQKNSNKKESNTHNGESTKGNDGRAMTDDFYQRDVQAEYEELDYDANEQFDDDDVDVGETEVVVEGGGFADEDDDDDFDEDGMEGEKASGAEGLASIAGLKLMIAKAKGEITPEQIAESDEKRKKEEADKQQRVTDIQSKQKDQQNEPVDHLTKIIVAAQDARVRAEKEQKEMKEAAAAAPASAIAASDGLTNKVNENGERIINLEAVRREIWLHHGTIKLKRLMKIFDIGEKASKERRGKFKQMVKELCTLETDPTGGRCLVLKQHYSNMG
jgi:hypothetical protein